MERIDENGKYVIDEKDNCTVELLIEPSEQWIQQNQPPYVPTEAEIDAQVVVKIRERYTENDEYKMLRISNYAIANNQPLPQEFMDYYNYAEQCRAWGQAEKQKYGLIE